MQKPKLETLSYLTSHQVSAFPNGREGAKFMLLSDLRGWNAAMFALYTLKSQQGKEDKEGQKEWPDLEEGSEAELKGELIWQLGSDAVKLCTQKTYESCCI